VILQSMTALLEASIVIAEVTRETLSGKDIQEESPENQRGSLAET